MDTKREKIGEIRQMALQCIPPPSGGLTELVLMHRQVARFKEMGAPAWEWVFMCVWINMVQLLQANCLALESEVGSVHECVWMWMSLFARLFLFPSKWEGGRPWRMRSSWHVCMHVHTPTNAQDRRAHTPPQWFNLMMGIGGETGVCEGQKSLNSNIHHCRRLPLSPLLHCHYCWPASSHYQLTSSNTLHYQLVLNRQMGWTLQQMTE